MREVNGPDDHNEVDCVWLMVLVLINLSYLKKTVVYEVFFFLFRFKVYKKVFKEIVMGKLV